MTTFELKIRKGLLGALSIILAGGAGSLLGSCDRTPAIADYNIVPMPRSVAMNDTAEGFLLDKNTTIVYDDPRLESCAGFLAGYIRHATGMNLGTATEPVDGQATITLSMPTDDPGNEGYLMIVDSAGVLIEASSPAGVFYGVQTLRKSLPVGRRGPVVLPAVDITDWPEMAWRGMHLDVARHFFDVSAVETYLDIMALHNLNTLHFHLTDDQGWRVEIKKYPLLTEIGGWRKDMDGKTIGGYFTQDEIRHLVAYAAQRHITIVPEIDMPGHMVAALASYPNLGCTGGPYVISGQPGVMREILCGGSDEVLTFLKDVFGEITELFPGEYVHLGGDEAPKYYWQRCPRCQAKIAELGLVSDASGSAENKLQGWLTDQIEEFLATKGRKVIGWDEILEGENVSPDVAVMSWRGVQGGIEAASKGHKVVMANNSSLYFDYYQTLDYEGEPEAIGGLNTLREVFTTEVFPPQLTPEQQKLIFGVQACLWTEYIDNLPKIEYMILPRMGGLSEVAWSAAGTAPEDRNFGEFLTRMEGMVKLYKKLGYNAAPYLFDVVMDAAPRTDHIAVVLTSAEGARIYYTLDGSTPNPESTLYTDTLRIAEATVLKATAFIGTGLESKMLTAEFNFNKASMHPIVARTQPDPRYNVQSLVDGLKGKRDFTLGNWVGYRRENLDVAIDLGVPTEVSEVKMRTLLDYGSHIMEATRITVSVSDDGEQFRTVAEIKDIEPIEVLRMKDIIPHTLTFAPQTARWVGIEMWCATELPRDHVFYGEDPFLFVDEIEIY